MKNFSSAYAEIKEKCLKVLILLAFKGMFEKYKIRLKSLESIVNKGFRRFEI